MEHVASVRRALARYPLLLDAVVAAAVLALSLPPLVNARSCGCDPAPTWGFGLVVLQAVLLLGRRRWPFTVGVAVGFATAVYGVTSLPDPAVPFAGLVAVYSAALYARRRLALLSAVLPAVGIGLALVLDGAHATAQDWSINYLVFATAWLLGWTTRTNREAADALRQRAEQLERTREAEAERAAVEERNRIAREMHDVVAHSLSLMIVQAEAGPVVVPRDPDRAVAAFDAISATGKSALVEMRRLLGVLRDDRDDPDTAPSRSPQQGLDGLGELVRSMRAAGLDIRLSETGERRPLDAAVDLSAYRIVQEALTNALRHAGPARVDVRLVHGGDELDVEVSDDGLGRRTEDTLPGKGLIGMRERVNLVGGSLSAGPREAGGWTVRATLPLRPAVPR